MHAAPPHVLPERPTPLWARDATALAAAVRAREVRAIEVVEAHVARVEATHAAVNAVVLPCFDDARRRAEELDRRIAAGEPVGPLAGVPVTIKDQLRVAGLPTTLGLASRRTAIDRDEGPAVTRLRRAGAIVLGKTNTPQLLFGFETDSVLHGRTNNPWDLERAPAASSGGEAANLAVGGAALGLGGDLGGSVRVPAAVCGLFGLRPTVGRLSLLDAPPGLFTPLLGISPQIGPLARSARDVGLALEVLVDAAEDRYDPTVIPAPLGDWRAVGVEELRVGFFDDDGLFRPSPAVRRAVHEAVASLAALGVHAEPIPPVPSERALQLAMGLLTAEGGANIRAALGSDTADPKLADTLRGMGSPRWAIALIATVLGWRGEARMARLMRAIGRKSARQIALLLAERDALRGAWLGELAKRRLDAVICPPCGLVAARHGLPDSAPLTCGYGFAFSLLDVPAGVAPVTRVRADEETDRAVVEPCDRECVRHEQGTAGLPVAVQVAGTPMHEHVVIALMAALETARRDLPDWPATPIEPR